MPDVERQSLTDLTARTATADSDLLHINSGGTDYKEQKNYFLKGSFGIEFENTSLLTSQIDALTTARAWHYEGLIIGNGHQTETGLPEAQVFFVYADIYASTSKIIEIVRAGDPNIRYVCVKTSGGWGSWTQLPARSEITSLNNSLTNSFTWKSSTEEASVATGTSWVKALQFSVTQSQFIRAFLRYSATPPSEIMITSGTTLGAVPVLAHAIAPSSGATAHPLYTPSVLLSPGTYYLYAKSTASGTNGVGIQRTNI